MQKLVIIKDKTFDLIPLVGLLSPRPPPSSRECGEDGALSFVDFPSVRGV